MFFDLIELANSYIQYDRFSFCSESLSFMFETYHSVVICVVYVFFLDLFASIFRFLSNGFDLFPKYSQRGICAHGFR